MENGVFVDPKLRSQFSDFFWVDADEVILLIWERISWRVVANRIEHEASV